MKLSEIPMHQSLQDVCRRVMNAVAGRELAEDELTLEDLYQAVDQMEKVWASPLVFDDGKRDELLSRALRALCLTRDYVGDTTLPVVDGWEWYEAGKALAEAIPHDTWAKEFWLRADKARVVVQPPQEATGEDLPTVGNSPGPEPEVAPQPTEEAQERDRRRLYIRALKTKLRCMEAALTDILGSCARLPEDAVTSLFVARRILATGVWFDMPPHADPWFERLHKEFRQGEILRPGPIPVPAVDQAQALVQELKQPQSLM